MTLSQLIPLVRKAEMSRVEVQNVIDILLNKQQDAPVIEEWSEVSLTSRIFQTKKRNASIINPSDFKHVKFCWDVRYALLELRFCFICIVKIKFSCVG